MKRNKLKNLTKSHFLKKKIHNKSINFPKITKKLKIHYYQDQIKKKGEYSNFLKRKIN